MKVLIVGSGGREHAIAWKIKQSPRLSALICAPGNPGTARVGVNRDVGAEDVEGLLRLARLERVDLTIVGPETPLVAGLVDRFHQEGLLIAGPNRAAAALEGSKAFAKEFMRRHRVPTAAYQTFASPEHAEEALREEKFQFPVVLKADGLAAGKGVFICRDLTQAFEAIDAVMKERKFGDAGKLLVVEEFLVGEEVSFMVFTDGRRALEIPPSQDHKALYEGDRGPNTGGMGAYSLDAILSAGLKRQIHEEIIEPTLRGMALEGRTFRGVLYAGLMLTGRGPKVLEFNVRLGDPEAQVILPRLESDLLDVMEGIARGDLQNVSVQWSQNATICVVLAAQGYPGPCQTGAEISGLELAEEVEGTIVFQAGTKTADGRLVTAGGRVLGVAASASSLEAAIMQAYEGVNKIHFDGMYCRRDIASKGLSK